MKVLLELLVVLCLIIAGWKQPFSAHYAQVQGKKVPASGGVSKTGWSGSGQPAGAATDKSWMWEKTKLDSAAKR